MRGPAGSNSQACEAAERQQTREQHCAAAEHAALQLKVEGSQDGDIRARDDALEASACRKVSLVLLPLLFAAAMLAYLDKGNLTFAAPLLMPDLGLSPLEFGIGSGLFYVGFGVGIVPSTFMTLRYGARAWFGAMSLAWGVISASQVFLGGRASFYALRLLLGLAEAGGTSTGAHLLANTYPKHRVALPFTFVVTAQVVSLVFAAPLAAGLMSLDGRGGLHGWQWLFLIEGIPSVLLGLAMWAWLPSSPLSAWMLTAAERQLLHLRVHGSPEEAEAASVPLRWASLPWLVWDALRRPLLWFFTAVGFLWGLGFVSMSQWLTILIKAMLSGTALAPASHTSGSGSGQPPPAPAGAGAGRAAAQSTEAILLSAVPAVCGALLMLVCGWHSDRAKEKTWHVALPYVAGGVLLALFSLFQARSWQAGFACLVLSMALVQAPMGVLSSKVLEALDTKAAGIGMALYVCLTAVLGGFVGPVVIGAMLQKLGGFGQALTLLGCLLVLSGLLMAGLGAAEHGWWCASGCGRWRGQPS